VEWWRTLEGVIALLFRLAQVEAERNLRPGRTLVRKKQPDVGDRWGAIRRWFSDGQPNSPARATALLTDLRDFRNEFEHASWQGTRSREHSRLTHLPAAANAADAVEAAVICSAVVAHVRYVIPGLDLMPNVPFPSWNYAFYDQLDSALEHWIMPFFARALDASDLTSRIAPYPPPPQLNGQAMLAAQMLIRYEDEHQLPDREVDLDAEQLFEELGVLHPQRPARGEDPRIPDYRRRP
jgi:hypothetical protein